MHRRDPAGRGRAAGRPPGHHHWAYCDTLAGRHPAIEVDPEPIYVRDGQIATSAGVTAGIDLALALVEEDLGRDVALTVARHLVVFLRRPGNQAQFSAQLAAQTAQREPLREVQQRITEHPEADLSVTALAERARLSPRHFARAFEAETGVTPGRYVDRVRLETARRLLEDTGDGVDQVARRSGYGTPEAMRRAFVKALGVAPAEYRRRFDADHGETMKIAILLYDTLTALDAVGPYEVLGRLPGAEAVFVADRTGPVRTDTGRLRLVAEARSPRRAGRPRAVPGGPSRRTCPARCTTGSARPTPPAPGPPRSARAR